MATEDITGDGLPDMMAIADTQLWAFTGYTGGSFSKAELLTDSSYWPTRDIVNVRDVTGDGVADMLYRGPDADRGLLLRQGKPAAGGGVDLNSLSTAADSATGADIVYGTAGWLRASMPIVLGGPNVSGSSTPDFWAVTSGGELRYYPGGTTAHGTPSAVGSGWTTIKALG
ncbi:FG-GAP-like repeat-containing protein [Streptomyces sp. NPDC101132]|uniref:FG-GAP-like repeat-containing protein n=1 Tax=Streptomyces sp. NPDC101132 TaxID=3366110 RepID=UPI003818E94A